MADSAASASEQLRAYVRARVKPGGAQYQRGNAAKLAKHFSVRGLGEDAAWISAYADPNAVPKRNADVDVALAICEFFGVDLLDFHAPGPGLSSVGSRVRTPGGADVAASSRLLDERNARIRTLEKALGRTKALAATLARLAAAGLEDRGTRTQRPSDGGRRSRSR